MNWAEYQKYDNSAKEWFTEIIEKNTKYKQHTGLNEELYKEGDISFKYDDRILLFELEVRHAFDDIVYKYNTIHIPIRKVNTPSDFYVVIKPDFQQFILIDSKLIQKNKDKIVTVRCEKEKNCDTPYIEDFVDIKKEDTLWYIVIKDKKLTKVKYF